MTYSIVARCPDTGQVGVATQSHWFAVGTLVPWSRSGAGAVATQAVTDVAYGPGALDAMANGDSAGEALQRLLAADANRDLRQVIVLDTEGRSAAHTGAKCVDYAGHAVEPGAAFAANLMSQAGVPEAMAASWRKSAGVPLAYRMLSALEAAEACGGDLRGQQSCALEVHSPAVGDWWEGLNIDVRVDDDRQPLTELRRLLDIRTAYTEAEFAEAAETDGRLREGAERFERASEVLPYSNELAFWKAIALLRYGDAEAALDEMRVVIGRDRIWAEVLRRLVKCGQVECTVQWMAEATA